MIKTRIALPALAAVAALSILAGCGSDSGSSSTDPASVAPPDSPIFVEATVRPSGALQSNIEALARKIAGIDDLGATITGLIESSATDSGEELDFETEIEPWLGERAGIFLNRFDGDDFEGSGFAIEVTDTGAAQDFIDKINEEDDESQEEASHEGVDFTVDEDGTAVGIVGNFIVLGDVKADFEAAVDASEGDSLADSDDYTGVVEAAPNGSLADVYVDIGRLVEESGSTIDTQTRQFLDTAGLKVDELAAVASLVPGSDRIEIALASRLGESEEGFVAPASADLLGSLPADSFAGADVGERLGTAVDAIDESGIPGEIPPNQLKSTLKQAGIDLEQITSNLEDAAVFAQGTDRSTLGGALVLTTKSSGEATSTVADVGTLLRASDVPGVTALSGQASGFSVRSPDLGDKPLVVAAKGERIAIGYGLPPTLAGLTESGRTLSALPAYKEAVSALGSTPISGFVDGAAALRLAEGLIPAEDRAEFMELKPYIGKIAYLALGSDKKGDLATAKLIAGLK